MHNTDVDTWKFWIVPPKDLDDKREFYRKVAETIQENSSNFPTLDASDTEMVNENHSVIKDLKRLVKIPDLGHFDLTNSRIGNLYVAHLIALRMDF